MTRKRSNAPARLLRSKRKAPAPQPITMDLLGVGKDGGLYVWEEAANVMPVSAFEMVGNRIKGGHYVIERRGAAITVHCAPTMDGRLHVIFMCGGLPDEYVSQEEIEPHLLGRVIPDPVAQARILEGLKRLTEDLQARQSEPHRRRGRLW